MMSQKAMPAGNRELRSWVKEAGLNATATTLEEGGDQPCLMAPTDISLRKQAEARQRGERVILPDHAKRGACPDLDR